MAIKGGDISATVRSAVAEALSIGEDEVTPNATLFDDLGVESIDLLDILFRIERTSGVKIQVADLASYVQGDMSDEDFTDSDGNVNAAGLAHLKTIMPQIDEAELAGNLPADGVMRLFTVQNLIEMVQARATAGPD
jgi:acyl carrier protein